MKVIKEFQYTSIFIAFILITIGCSKNEEAYIPQDNQKSELFGDKEFTNDIIEKIFAEYSGSANFANYYPGWNNESIFQGKMSATFNGFTDWNSNMAGATTRRQFDVIYISGNKENGEFIDIALRKSDVESGMPLSAFNGVYYCVYGNSDYGDHYYSENVAEVYIDFYDQNTISGRFEFIGIKITPPQGQPLQVTNGEFTNLQIQHID